MTTTYVYVCLDADRQPLYVGCTNNVTRRLREHKSYGTGWVEQVDHVMVTEFSTRKEALAAESERIQSLRPLNNLRDNPRFKSLARAVAEHEWFEEWRRANFERRSA